MLSANVLTNERHIKELLPTQSALATALLLLARNNALAKKFFFYLFFTQNICNVALRRQQHHWVVLCERNLKTDSNNKTRVECVMVMKCIMAMT